MGAEKLVRKTDQLDSTLLLLDRLTTEAGQLLEVLGTSLHQLTVLTAPVHSRATALTHAQQNIASTKQAVDELVQHLDTSRRVSGYTPKIEMQRSQVSSRALMHLVACAFNLTSRQHAETRLRHAQWLT